MERENAPEPPFFNEVKIRTISLWKIALHGRRSDGDMVYGLLQGRAEMNPDTNGPNQIIVTNSVALPFPVEPLVVYVPSATVTAETFAAALTYNQQFVGRLPKNIIGWYISSPREIHQNVYDDIQWKCQTLQEPFICLLHNSTNGTMRARRYDSRIQNVFVPGGKYSMPEISYFSTAFEEDIFWNTYPCNGEQKIQPNHDIKMHEKNCAKAESMILEFGNHGLILLLGIFSAVVSGSFSCYNSPSFTRYYWLPLLLLIFGSIPFVVPLALTTNKYKAMVDTLEKAKSEFRTNRPKQRAGIVWVLGSLMFLFVALIVTATVIIP